jgi:hypothetical protein
MGNFQVWPYVKTQTGWSIPDELMWYVWTRLEKEGKVEKLFWGGNVYDTFDFMDFLRRPTNHPLLLVDMDAGKPCAVAWLNGIEGNHAIAHFAILGNYRRGMGSTVFEFWRQFRRDDGEPLVKVLMGFTPANNDKAVKFTRYLGFQILGTVPHLCELPYENKTVGAVVSYYDLQNGGKHGRR